MMAVVAIIQTFGDFLCSSPHLHILASDGCFEEAGVFYASPAKINAEELGPLSRCNVLSMLNKKGLIAERTIEFISS